MTDDDLIMRSPEFMRAQALELRLKNWIAVERDMPLAVVESMLALAFHQFGQTQAPENQFMPRAAVQYKQDAAVKVYTLVYTLLAERMSISDEKMRVALRLAWQGGIAVWHTMFQPGVPYPYRAMSLIPKDLLDAQEPKPH